MGIKQTTPAGQEPAPAYTAPSFTGTWVNFGGTLAVAGYLMMGGVVYLRGTIKSGTIGTSAFTLPASMRPSATILFACNSSGALGILQINSDGTVVPAAGSNVSFSLDPAVYIPQ